MLQPLNIMFTLSWRRPLNCSTPPIALLNEVLEGNERRQEHGALRLENARIHVVEEVSHFFKQNAKTVVTFAFLRCFLNLAWHSDPELAELSHFSEKLDEPGRVIDSKHAWKAHNALIYKSK